MQANFHEDLRAHAGPRGGSDRQFGLVFAGVCAVVTLWPLFKGGAARWPGLLFAALFLVAALARPSILHPLNRLWMRIGMLLGAIVNPIVTALLFFLVFTPAGMLARALGKDPLRLRRAPEATTYWIPRLSNGETGDTHAKQF